MRTLFAAGRIAPRWPGAHPDTIYLGDNGRALCGAHLGAYASITGRDLSGQDLYPITPADLDYLTRHGGGGIACEECGKRPSPLWTPA